MIDEAGRIAPANPRLNTHPYLIFFDIMPGNCPNSLNPKKQVVIQAAVPSSPGFDLHSIDPSTLELYIDGSIVQAIQVFYEDISSPAIGWLCRCYVGKRDGEDDLVMKFSAQEVIRALGPVSRGDEITIFLRGKKQTGLLIEMRDCITIVGNSQGYGTDHNEGIDISK